MEAEGFLQKYMTKAEIESNAAVFLLSNTLFFLRRGRSMCSSHKKAAL